MTILLRLVFRLGTAMEALGARIRVFASARLLPGPLEPPSPSRSWSLASVLEDPTTPHPTPEKPRDPATNKQKSRTND
jgi:cell division protein FtsN